MRNAFSQMERPFVSFLQDEAPWELERLKSIKRLATLWPDYCSDRSVSLSYGEFVLNQGQ
jgi:hypothetical protein